MRPLFLAALGFYLNTFGCCSVLAFNQFQGTGRYIAGRAVLESIVNGFLFGGGTIEVIELSGFCFLGRIRGFVEISMHFDFSARVMSCHW